jgi:hypothetical protein
MIEDQTHTYKQKEKKKGTIKCSVKQ